MEFFKQELVEGQINTINVGYADGYHQLPVMVELKPVGEAIPLASTLAEDQRVQLFNINPVQFTSQGQIQYVQALPPLQYHGRSFSAQRTIDTQTPDNTEIIKHACEICGAVFKSPQSLARHHSSHPEIAKSYHCHHCNKVFGNQQALRRHQSKHPDIEYEWKCRFCPQSFPYKTTLSKHVKVHAGEKLFRCESCQKRFGNRYSLLRHSRIHTGEVPYKCEVCEKGFLKASDFGRHIRTHTGERPFECPTCCKTFTQKSCLVKHCEKKHNTILETVNVVATTLL